MKLRQFTAENFPRSHGLLIDSETLAGTQEILDAVRRNGDEALRLLSVKFKDVDGSDPFEVPRSKLLQALETLPSTEREVLQRTADRIKTFAEAQLGCIKELTVEIPGGKAGHKISPIFSCGCYAPGGRFPLPSSVLMTAITAKVAGVSRVVVASPRPTQVTLAAAALADADCFLQLGGAQAIAALAFGTESIEKVDLIVGPGNRWVTAAKKLVSGEVGIDMLAGPTELVVIADTTANPKIVAADLLAQAEHDEDALPILITFDGDFLRAVEQELGIQLKTLPTAAIAEKSLQRGFAVICDSLQQAATVSNQLAPEHLELAIDGPKEFSKLLTNYGALFIGQNSAEVLGDYGAGPNHVLPTGTTARFTGGLSVLNFLRVQSWIEVEDLSSAQKLIPDTITLARLEGLEAHARAAEIRKK